MKRQMTPVILERILFASMVIMLIGGFFAFTTIDGLLKESAKQTNHTQINADIGRDTIDQLRFLDTYIKQNKDTIDRAATIVADSKQYSYQNQIISDINTYASKAGVSVTGYSFQQTTAQKGSKVVAGLKTISASLTLKSPMPYKNFLRFLMAIEQNLTKMQVTGVSLTPSETNNNQVTNPTVGLEVYVQ